MKIAVPGWRQWLVGAVMVGVAVFIGSYARKVDWSAVAVALRALSPASLLAALSLAALSYLLYGSFDIIARNLVAPRLTRVKAMVVAMVSYTFNLNIGTLVGGVGFRYRLYSRLGLKGPQITQIVGLSMLTNWLAYPLLGGAVLLMNAVQIPPEWGWHPRTLHVTGALMCALTIGYLLLCALSSRRSWRVRDQELTLPSWRVAATQLLLSAANWLAIAAVADQLMPPPVPYVQTLGALLLSAVAGVMAHIPGGLGVTEAVFLAVLGDHAPHGTLLAGLLAFRGIYYLTPLLPALLAYLQLEASTRHRRHPAAA